MVIVQMELLHGQVSFMKVSSHLKSTNFVSFGPLGKQKGVFLLDLYFM